ncbi:hypothetical protein ACGFYF_42405 [Streptomyces lavendulae]|uniref:hypothetical protein n=1 Tax=Streptomyces lavendulae TaxID=1914 RepID=UPI0037118E12
MNRHSNVFVEPVRYLVSCLPESHPERRNFTVQVQYWDGWWSVRWRSRLLGSTGTWSWPFSPADSPEPSTAAPDDELAQKRRSQWLADHRFDHDTALALAEKVAAELRTKDGLSVTDVLVQAARRGPQPRL